MIICGVILMKLSKFIKLLKDMPMDYDVVFPPEDYKNVEIYKNDTFEQVCIELYPMSKKDLLNELNNG